MKLSIDSSGSEKIVIAINGKKYVTETKDRRSQKLLSFISETLKANNASTHDLSEIEVVTGPGSFTGIRVGVSVASALGFALNIPVNGSLVLNAPVEIKY